MRNEMNPTIRVILEITLSAVITIGVCFVLSGCMMNRAVAYQAIVESK